jgi:uncharacterized membrane protein
MFRSVMLRRPSFAGLVGTLVFFWFSLTPSLLPRWWIMQAVITALSSAIGYLIGTTLGAIGRAFLRRVGWNPASGSACHDGLLHKTRHETE